MSDQAQRLREKLSVRSAASSSYSSKTAKTRVIAVTSGKGGVGKSNVSLNFALCLQQKGQKVVLFDMDVGFANIDVLMGISTRRNIVDLIDKRLSIWDIIERGPNDLEFVAGGSGLSQIFELDEIKLHYFFEQLTHLHGYADTIILDTSAGMSKDTLRFLLAADEVILVTTPEPTAITDAYALVKMAHSQKYDIRFNIVVNRAVGGKEGKVTGEKLVLVAREFLNLEMNMLGFIYDDVHVSKAVKKQQPFCLAYPRSKAANCIRNLTEAYLTGGKEANTEGMKGFISRLRVLWK
ncbi:MULTISPECIES: MinD/ParA family protein [Aneurinibacillus]|uniref:Flagellar biosynthesis protein FlhG n=1 Tax=Aneurinibacillus thermoaerophilus TaxID=143495 RepID=A0A1G7WF72_ANETH|nr:MULTISPECIES: MinD/ParA family protein [Aneurinibacillus]AMA72687.1 cobyrinic acid a,c-diamide synthase [Aneurinibacillus sp. XH2]MED0674595.1 MinD/ParA family protein [Aneurinibacillus thermoaerophilus]MED0677964.1 MinD/ParA family protein [Aneurinibacillus thermoaerophilus]MED0736973.1 MinD/ParA family protein [Aneurinibacillus thermoaerophilus]MED0756814.1 MinD/ParA family protein [Aneurinibacillus thermoaerophilus]